MPDEARRDKGCFALGGEVRIVAELLSACHILARALVALAIIKQQNHADTCPNTRRPDGLQTTELGLWHKLGSGLSASEWRAATRCNLPRTTSRKDMHL